MCYKYLRKKSHLQNRLQSKRKNCKKKKRKKTISALATKLIISNFQLIFFLCEIFPLKYFLCEISPVNIYNTETHGTRNEKILRHYCMSITFVKILNIYLCR